jgi:lipopolysaccharide transport system permease protein
MSVSAAPVPAVTIAPERGWASLKLGDVWEFRGLLFFLVWRDVKVRYKQTLLGAAWAILQPLLTMIVFTIFFGRLAGVGSEGLPYPLFSYAGLLPWTYFAQAVTLSSQSLVSSQNLIRKVYFPRLVVPSAAVLAGLVDLALASVVLGGLMAAYRVAPPIEALWLPAFALLAVVTALAAGLWLAALNVKYRDVRYVVPFLVQIWLFVTPVIYPARRVLERLEQLSWPGWIYGLNPMVGVVEGFRWAALGAGQPPGPVLAASAAVSLAALVGGAFYFRRVEREFADVV